MGRVSDAVVEGVNVLLEMISSELVEMYMMERYEQVAIGRNAKSSEVSETVSVMVRSAESTLSDESVSQEEVMYNIAC